MQSMASIVKTLYEIVKPQPEEFVKTLYNTPPKTRAA